MIVFISELRYIRKLIKNLGCINDKRLFIWGERKVIIDMDI